MSNVSLRISVLKTIASIAVMAGLNTGATTALAQSPDPEPVIDWQKHVSDTQRLGALGDDLMGDQIDFNNGAVTFEHTDVSLPGNNALSVAIKRRLTRGILYDKSEASEFGDWEIVVPRISAVTAETTNFRTGNRCSDGNQFQSITMALKLPPGNTGSSSTYVQGHEYSQGLQLSTTENGAEQVLRSGITTTFGPFTSSDKYVTRSNFKISCLSNITGGGEGFLGVSPTGVSYRFDRYYERHTQDQILSNYEDADAKRYKSIVAATEVTDVHGNWVKYDYDSNNRLTRIHSNDGRDITLGYTSANSPISSVTVNGRTWTYAYATKAQIYSYVEWGNAASQSGQEFHTLKTVTLPDSRSWIIEALNFNKPGELDGCTPYQNLTPLGGDFDVLIKHPAGAWGKFKFENIRRRVGLDILETKQTYGTSNVNTAYPNGAGVTLACPSLHSINQDFAIEQAAGELLYHTPAIGDDQNTNGGSHSDYAPTRPANLLMSRSMMALTKKEIVDPSITTMSWSVDYSEIPLVHYTDTTTIPAVAVNDRTNWTKIVEPNLAETTHFYHWDAETYGGELKREETRETAGASSTLRAKDYTHTIQSVSVGIPEFNSIYPPAKQRNPVYQTKQIISQDGDTYTSETAYNQDIYATDYSFGKPTQTQSYSNLTLGYTTHPKRITDSTYIHDTTKWILGLTDKVTQNGRELVDYDYDTNGQVLEEKRFTHSYATFGYNTDGTPHWAKDAMGREIRAANFKRGTAQEITKGYGTPEAVIIEQTVDDNGWIEDSTDGKGQITTYIRDDMGRLTTYDPPGQFFSNTNIAYDFTGPITQTITKGQAKTTVSYDAMLRPTLVKTEATDTGWASHVKTDYDGAGQITFESFPSILSTPSVGTTYTYDGLRRIKDTTNPIGTTETDYYSSHRTDVKDPEGNTVITYRTGYDGPGKGQARVIYEYTVRPWDESRTTSLYHNVWGELEYVTQQGLNGGNETQLYTYDDRRRICRYHTDEGGSTAFEYDNSGYLTNYEKGLTYSGSCPALSATAQGRVELEYDGLGRLEKTDFNDWGTHDIIRSYDANSNLLHVTRGGGTDKSHWSYAYNEMNQLTYEYLDLDYDGDPLTNYDSFYRYNADGHIYERKLPNDVWVDHVLDGLGRDLTVTWNPLGANTDLIDNVTYHPDGQVASFDYGNGHGYTRQLDNMLRPDHVYAQASNSTAFDRQYTYTLRGQVETVDDHVDSSYNQSFIYDGLGQLTTATGKWGSATFDYDAIGNIKSKVFSDWQGNGNRAVNMTYDGLNRLQSYTDTGPLNDKALTYDIRGNVTALGGLNMDYDYSDQPTSMSGTVTAEYKYDGHLKRVKSEIGSGTNLKKIYNVYDKSGALTFVDKRTDGEEVTTVRGAGMSIARVIYDGLTEEITYIHGDHLGSVSTGTDTSGTVKWREHYSPFGEALTPNAANDNLATFTGHIRDVDTGLTYMQARYYDPVSARFLSIDPVTFLDTGNPGMFNRYAYTFNDPINMIDPDGKFGRGSGFTDKQWKKFDKAQTKAAEKMTKRAGKLESKAAKRDAKGKSGGDDMRSQASALRGGAEALQSDGSDGLVANAVDQEGYTALGGTEGGAAMVKNGTTVYVNTDNSTWSSSGTGAQRAVGHESLHTNKVGLKDQRGPSGARAYKYGLPNQQKAYKALKGTPKAIINPDHVMDTVY